MPRKFYKYKLLFDEGFHLRDKFPITNSRFSIKHVAADYKLASLPDPEVYKLAKKDKRLVITYNIKDFRRFAEKSKDSGIIGISPNLTLEQIDKKLTALLVNSTQKSLFGRLTQITGETEK